MTDVKLSRYMEGQLKDALRDLEMPDSYYEKAITSYNSLSSELESSEALRRYEPEIILQGSIRIGTAVKPITDEGSYDVDVVCNLNSLTKDEISQCDLKRLVGKEVCEYAAQQNMKKSPVEGKRCWTLEYMDEANFHIDVLPTVDDSYVGRLALALSGNEIAPDERFLSYTDSTHPRYNDICSDWPITNPVGYAEWFLTAARYENHKAIMAASHSASIDEIKIYEVKAPLQTYVQLLKRHRDIYDDKLGKDRTIRSIVLTTLAAKAYENIEVHGEWYEDLIAVLRNLPMGIDQSGNSFVLANPANALENFISDWDEDDYKSFLQWHASVLGDYDFEGKARTKSQFNRYARDELRSSLGLPKGRKHNGPAETLRLFLDNLSHHQHHGLTEIDVVPVSITAEKQRNGGMYKVFSSDTPLPKDVRLRFSAHADGLEGYTVRWQVTNDGFEAANANCLRGGFYESINSAKGRKIRAETTRYVGRHYVECLLEKDDVIYGRSEPFVVNIVNGDAGHRNW